MPIEMELPEGARRVRIRVTGRLDFPRHAEMRRAWESHPAGTCFDVDLAAAEYLDSSALGMLLLLRRHAGDTDDCVRLLAPSDAVRRILAVARFDRLFAIAPA